MCSRSTKHEGKVGREWLLSVPHEFDVPQGRSDTREWLGQNWQKETALHRDRQKYSHWTKNNWVNPQTSTTASKYQNNPSGWGAANFQRLGDYSGKTDLTCSCTLACVSTMTGVRDSILGQTDKYSDSVWPLWWLWQCVVCARVFPVYVLLPQHKSCSRPTLMSHFSLHLLWQWMWSSYTFLCLQ